MRIINDRSPGPDARGFRDDGFARRGDAWQSRDCCPPAAHGAVVAPGLSSVAPAARSTCRCVFPRCCADAPCVRFQRTLIGDGKTVFTWQCGHEVVVRYTTTAAYRVIERG